jgi:hypothetical protein
MWYKTSNGRDTRSGDLRARGPSSISLIAATTFSAPSAGKQQCSDLILMSHPVSSPPPRKGTERMVDHDSTGRSPHAPRAPCSMRGRCS